MDVISFPFFCRICCQNETLQQFLTLRFRGDEAGVPETSDLAILLCPVTIAPQAVRKPTSKSSVAFAHPHAPFQFHSLRRSLLPAIASVTSRKGGDLLLVPTAKIQFASSSLGLVYPQSLLRKAMYVYHIILQAIGPNTLVKTLFLQ